LEREKKGEMLARDQKLEELLFYVHVAVKPMEGGLRSGF